VTDTWISLTKNNKNIPNKAKVMKITVIHNNLSHHGNLNILVLVIIKVVVIDKVQPTKRSIQNIHLFLMESIHFLMQAKNIILLIKISKNCQEMLKLIQENQI
jgi:hypothetical protein